MYNIHCIFVYTNVIVEQLVHLLSQLTGWRLWRELSPPQFYQFLSSLEARELAGKWERAFLNKTKIQNFAKHIFLIITFFYRYLLDFQNNARFSYYRPEKL